MEPVFMILGQAAGVAAGLAIDGKTAVQKVPIATLHARLKKHKAVLDLKSLPKGPAKVAGLDIRKMAGVVVDDAIGSAAPGAEDHRVVRRRGQAGESTVAHRGIAH